jgi:hypothetical protein
MTIQKVLYHTEHRKLRLGKGGRMRVTKFRKEELLPLNPGARVIKNFSRRH